MSSVKCARCDKTVYPIEELKCLDKSWHKGCFKCQECGMTLNMKTYKGFSRQPYCAAHCPKASHTTVADTPEARRLAENTRNQSQVKYHEDFEKAKGKITQVADDPETLRIKNTSKMISNALYHGEYEKKKQMEEKRTLCEEMPANGNGHIQTGNSQMGQAMAPQSQMVQMLPPPQQVSQAQIIHHQQQQSVQKQYVPNEVLINNHNGPRIVQKEMMYQKQPQMVMTSVGPGPGGPAPGMYPTPQQQAHHNMMMASPHGMVHNSAMPTSPMKPTNMHMAMNGNGMQSMPMQQQQQQAMMGHPYPQMNNHHNHNSHPQQQGMSNAANNKWTSPYSAKQHSTLIYSSEHGPVHQMPNRMVGSIADYDPVNENFGSVASSHRMDAQQAMYYGGVAPNMNNQTKRVIEPQQQAQQPHVQGVVGGGDGLMRRSGAGLAVRAMYDYAAQDTDEVSFHDGDLIINCMAIDDGWMTGTVQRTGQTGMLPANYVESVN